MAGGLWSRDRSAGGYFAFSTVALNSSISALPILGSQVAYTGATASWKAFFCSGVSSVTVLPAFFSSATKSLFILRLIVRW